jgi:hypothetical protein
VSATLERFDDDRLIPAYGFGDLTTGGKSCFPFFPTRPCVGLGEVLSRYTELAQTVTLSGPTNFAPVIREAIRIVKDTGSYHILVRQPRAATNSRRVGTTRCLVPPLFAPVTICL